MGRQSSSKPNGDPAEPGQWGVWLEVRQLAMQRHHFRCGVAGAILHYEFGGQRSDPQSVAWRCGNAPGRRTFSPPRRKRSMESWDPCMAARQAQGVPMSVDVGQVDGEVCE